jgi:hypothetical protein
MRTGSIVQGGLSVNVKNDREIQELCVIQER